MTHLQFPPASGAVTSAILSTSAQSDEGTKEAISTRGIFRSLIPQREQAEWCRQRQVMWFQMPPISNFFACFKHFLFEQYASNTIGLVQLIIFPSGLGRIE
jgi:hypothetical protein